MIVFLADGVEGGELQMIHYVEQDVFWQVSETEGLHDALLFVWGHGFVFEDDRSVAILRTQYEGWTFMEKVIFFFSF